MRWGISFLCLLLISCARAPLKNPDQAFRLASSPPEILDSYSPESLRDGLRRLLAVYDSSPNIPNEFRFGSRVVTREQYKRALVAAEARTSDLPTFSQFVRDNFEFYEVYGSSKGWGTVFSTGYFAPVIEGRLAPSKEFDQPLYKTPEDLVTIDLADFAAKYPETEWLRQVVDDKRKKPFLRGRLVRGPDGARIVAYSPRKEIDVVSGERPLGKKKLELAWVRPIDAFYLQIQGSGIVEVGPGKRFVVSYDKSNGYTWYPIGRSLTDVIPLEKMTMQRVRQHLETLPRERLQEVLNRDPSYVFFRKIETAPLSYAGVEVTAQRTIATDSFLLPKGTLAFFDVELPVFDGADPFEPSSWERRPRFVFDIDTGGAIKGGGRVDLYVGEGHESGQIAGVMKRHGRLWYLAPKPEFLERLQTASN